MRSGEVISLNESRDLDPHEIGQDIFILFILTRLSVTKYF